MPVYRRVQEFIVCLRHGRGGNVCNGCIKRRNLALAALRAIASRACICTDNSFYTRNRSTGADARDYNEKTSPGLYAALGVFLPLITTNCAVLGVAIIIAQKDYDFVYSIVYAVATALGFALALMIMAGIRTQLSITDVPQPMRGVPVALITAGILAMAFMGFAGIKF